MKNILRIALIIGFWTFQAQAKFFNLVCTTTYTQNGVSNSAWSHAVINLEDSENPKLTYPLGLSPSAPAYDANVEISGQPDGLMADWHLWFTRHGETVVLKEKTEEISLDKVNNTTLQFSPTWAELLAFSCSFPK